MANQQIDVQIMGQSYLLSCPTDGEAKLLEAVHRVDAAMCRIRDAGKIKARDRIAVLAALNLAFDLSNDGVLAPEPTAAAPRAPDPRLTVLLGRLDAALGSDDNLL